MIGMRKLLIATFILISFILWTERVIAQEISGDRSGIQIIDMVELKDGSTLRGTVQSRDELGNIVLELTSGAQAEIAYEDIERVYQATFDGKRLRTAPNHSYAFRESGMYATTSGGIITGNSGERIQGKTGYSFDLSGGYRFNRWVGLGLHAGYRSFAAENNERFVPVGIEVIGYLTRTRVAPFYSLRTGYGIAVDEGDENISAKGGFYMEPMMGVRIGASSGLNAIVGFGYTHQRASYEYAGFNPWIWPGNDTLINHAIRYHRWTFRIGMTF